MRAGILLYFLLYFHHQPKHCQSEKDEKKLKVSPKLDLKVYDETLIGNISYFVYLYPYIVQLNLRKREGNRMEKIKGGTWLIVVYFVVDV